MAKQKRLPKSLIPVDGNVKKILELAYNMQTTDKKTALRIIDKIPDLVDNDKAAIAAMQQSCTLMYQSNQENMQSFNDACQAYLNTCRDIVNSGTLSHGQQLEVLDRMENVLKLMAEKDSENKKFIFEGHLQTICTIGGSILLVLAAAIGIRSSSNKSTDNEEDDDEPKELNQHYDNEN